MRCLYIVAQGPLSPKYRGGGSIYYEQLASLASLGHEIHLWHYAYPDARREFDAFVASDADTYAAVQRMCKSITYTTLPLKPSLADRLTARTADWLTGESIRNPHFRTLGLRKLTRLIATLHPDFIWAQHFGPAQIAVLQSAVPVVYSHTDWLYKVKALAQGIDEDLEMRQMEERVARRAASVVSGSLVECQQLRTIGCRAVTYIPVAYDSATVTMNGALKRPRIVHLGALATTANRVGLERFFECVWPSLAQDDLDLWIIGDTCGAGALLERHFATVMCTGYVQDLGTVLRPYDLHIIPWEHDTGQRTRLPLVFNYGQVVIALRASVAGFPGLIDGENCRLVDRLDQMADVIRELLGDTAQRRRLGTAARETFESSFTRQALLHRYNAVLSTISRPDPVPIAAELISQPALDTSKVDSQM
jgi:glycosyltransferase involved in cell wall biosynthesis